jgi:hypothetical protein
MMHPIGVILLAGICLLQCSFAWSSGGSIVSAGAFGCGGGGATGNREWINLKGPGGLLKGATQASLVKMIIVYVPDMQESHLILRQLKLTDNQDSILISAPSELQSKTIRATLFLEDFSDKASLYEYIDGTWERRHPVHLMNHDNRLPDSGTCASLRAYPVKRLGYYCIAESAPDQNVGQPPVSGRFYAKLLPGGSIWLGSSPVVLAGILITIWAIISYLLHRIEQNKGY